MFYGDIMGLEDASGLRSDQPCKGDEFNKVAPGPPAPAAPAPAAGENGARPADEPPTPPAVEGAEAGTGDPAPVDSASRAPCAALRLVTSQAAAAVKNKASMSFSKALCARFEH